MEIAPTRQRIRAWVVALCIPAALGLPEADARGATLPFAGSLTMRLGAEGSLPFPFPLPITGNVMLPVTSTGYHLRSILFDSDAFGPASFSLPATANATVQSVRFTSLANSSGTLFNPGPGPTWNGALGLQGVMRICIIFKSCIAATNVPFTPTGTPARGFGVGGTQTVIGSNSNVNVTLRHAAWATGTPVMTIHSPTTTVTTPALPGGFVHDAVSATSSTFRGSGSLQLVTASKVFTSIDNVVPELPLVGVLSLHIQGHDVMPDPVPEPGTLLLLASAAALATARRKRGRFREESPPPGRISVGESRLPLGEVLDEDR